jgi:SOS-response transcriptional repressor LexA
MLRAKGNSMIDAGIIKAIWWYYADKLLPMTVR